MSQSSGTGSAYILRIRAGVLLLGALVIFSASGGSFVARKLSLGWGWAVLVALVLALALGVAVMRLSSKIYFAIGAVATLLAAYLAYDFCNVALDWSTTTSLVWGVVLGLVVAAAFYDFSRIKGELRRWVFPH